MAQEDTGYLRTDAGKDRALERLEAVGSKPRGLKVCPNCWDIMA